MWFAYWVVAGALAALFLAAGATKLVRSRPALAASGMRYVDDFTDGQVKLIGVAEMMGAVGLIVPMLTGIAAVLSPVAAAALTVLMAGAVATHTRRDETFMVPLVLAVASAGVAVLGILLLG